MVCVIVGYLRKLRPDEILLNENGLWPIESRTLRVPYKEMNLRALVAKKQMGVAIPVSENLDGFEILIDLTKARETIAGHGKRLSPAHSLRSWREPSTALVSTNISMGSKS